MNHRTVIQWSIVAIIAILIMWSIVNLATYAHIYHASWSVWTLGIAIGAANAVSVYAFVIAHTKDERLPAGIGIALFGGASGILQMLLYLHEGAPLAAAIPFGWIGPVAEGVLSWLHAALSENAMQRPQNRTRKTAPKVQSATAMQPQETAPQVALTANMIEAYNMQRNGMGRKEIAEAKGVSLRTVDNWLAKAKAATNGGDDQ